MKILIALVTILPALPLALAKTVCDGDALQWDRCEKFEFDSNGALVPDSLGALKATVEDICGKSKGVAYHIVGGSEQECYSE